MLTNEEKIKIINDKIEAFDIHIEWLNQNIGMVEEILSPGKLSMQEQLESIMLKKNALLDAIDQLQLNDII
jgi:hypothetical protein